MYYWGHRCPFSHVMLSIFLLLIIFSPSHHSFASIQSGFCPRAWNWAFSNQMSPTIFFILLAAMGDPCHHPADTLRIPLSEPFPMVCEPHSISTSLWKFQFLKLGNTESLLNSTPPPPKKLNFSLAVHFSLRIFYLVSYSFWYLLYRLLSSLESIFCQCYPFLPS